MSQLKIDQLAKGTRIILDAEAEERRLLLNKLIELAHKYSFSEVTLPCIEKASLYTDKAGPEVLGQMYTFPDKGGRELCLRPEGTATIQALARKHWKRNKDVKLWYFTPCWRYEQPQAGRYREFYQFGVEWINPKDSELASKNLIELAQHMVSLVTLDYAVDETATRGLSYYLGDGFEISVPSLGAQKQVVGGGSYEEGVGFAVGFDRLMIVN